MYFCGNLNAVKHNSTCLSVTFSQSISGVPSYLWAGLKDGFHRSVFTSSRLAFIKVLKATSALTIHSALMFHVFLALLDCVS